MRCRFEPCNRAVTHFCAQCHAFYCAEHAARHDQVMWKLLAQRGLPADFGGYARPLAAAPADAVLQPN